MKTNVSCSPHDVANKLLIWCLTIITHSASYAILGDVYFVVQGICVENWFKVDDFLAQAYNTNDVCRCTNFKCYGFQTPTHGCRSQEQ
jgi:hypothetical protein